MTRQLRGIVLAAALSAAVAGVASPEEVTIWTSYDASVTSLYPDANSDSEDYLWVGHEPGGDWRWP